MTFANRAHQYARDVVGGQTLACRWVRLACQRHLDDIEQQDDSDFPFEFDPRAVDWWCTAKEMLPHVKGVWAGRGELFRMSDWQVFITASVFGWKWKATGKRRFTVAYIEVPRKNGKSTDTAATANAAFIDDTEFGAEVYSGAASKKQAYEVFGPALKMVSAKASEEWRKEFGIEVHAQSMTIPSRNAKFEPLIGNPGDGASPSFSVTDEYHEHLSANQFNTMITGMGAREQPLAWVITTAGTDISSPCYELRTQVTEMLEEKVKDDALFGIIYTLDEGDDWTTEESLRKCNPNYGVSVFKENLLREQQRAINHPRLQSVVKMKHFNIWSGASSPYFNSEKWSRLKDESLSPEQFHGEAMWGGMDLASRIDLTCSALVFKREIEGDDHFYVFVRHYCAEEVASAPEQRRYSKWAAEGYLIATPGARTDHRRVRDDWLEDSELYRIVSVPYDPYDASSVAEDLIEAGVLMVELAQTSKRLSAPMKEIGALIEAGHIHHNGDPILAWAIGNTTATPDRNENVFPRKEKAQNKIDPVVALIHAMWGAMNTEEEVSVYRDRGFLTLGA